MSIEVEATPVHYHNCPALGPQARIVRATLLDSKQEWVIGYQHKCPFCGETAGDFEFAEGVTSLPDGTLTLDPTKAIKVVPG